MSNFLEYSFYEFYKNIGGIIMIDKLKVLNFLQDFGCAKLEHLQILFDSKNDNFKSILSSNMVSKKGDILSVIQ